MLQDDDHVKDSIGCVPANRVVIPIIVTIVALHVLVIFLFFSISKESSELSAIMQRTGEYTSAATDLLAGPRCNSNLKRDSSERVAAANVTVTRLRHGLWAVTIGIILLLVFAFAIIYGQILMPMKRYESLPNASPSALERRTRTAASAWAATSSRW